MGVAIGLLLSGFVGVSKDVTMVAVELFFIGVEFIFIETNTF
jgi:hypothetical protein